MFAIAFDLVVADTEQHHPKGVSQAYAEIGATLAQFGFRRVQGSLYVTDDEDMAQLFNAIQSLKAKAHGSRRPCGIFAPSALNNGPISRGL